jgi:hypothetical protein
MGEGWVGVVLLQYNRGNEGYPIPEILRLYTNEKTFILVSGPANVLNATGLACREPRRLSGAHPHPTLPHQGGGLYYVAYVELFARHYTTWLTELRWLLRREDHDGGTRGSGIGSRGQIGRRTRVKSSGV